MLGLSQKYMKYARALLSHFFRAYGEAYYKLLNEIIIVTYGRVTPRTGLTHALDEA